MTPEIIFSPPPGCNRAALAADAQGREARLGIPFTGQINKQPPSMRNHARSNLEGFITYEAETGQLLAERAKASYEIGTVRAAESAHIAAELQYTKVALHIIVARERGVQLDAVPIQVTHLWRDVQELWKQRQSANRP